MPQLDLAPLRHRIREKLYVDETSLVTSLAEKCMLKATQRSDICLEAAGIVASVRECAKPSMMEAFLAEYGLSTSEGVALMSLAEALLRVPDAHTISHLIEDKIGGGKWQEHLGKADSFLINSATWGLLLTGKLLGPSDQQRLGSLIHRLVKRLGEPILRLAVSQVMREMGRQFVLGQNINDALRRAQKMQRQGYTYSYDMLGEAAKTKPDAERYFCAYADAIRAIAPHCSSDVRDNPGISVKLSALHCRYEYAQRDQVLSDLVPKVCALANAACDANMGFNIDAEESERLDLSLDIIQAVIEDSRWGAWQGFGVVVQAYSKRASFVIDWLYALSQVADCKIMVRLVKGAYWDSEIKHAQVIGAPGYPVFTRKVNTDISYLSCARKLLAMNDRIYPQFATHNAHTVAAIMALASSSNTYEFQRLHGMGDSLYQQVMQDDSLRCRIYAPVGAHEDLLAYLVRRLLENGANSSFVHQLVDTQLSPEQVVEDPFKQIRVGNFLASTNIPLPEDMFGKERRNSRGWDLSDPITINTLLESRHAFMDCQWKVFSLVGEAERNNDEQLAVVNPAALLDVVGVVANASQSDIDAALQASLQGQIEWVSIALSERANILRRVADVFEDNVPELLAIACREAGKTLADAISEIREAVDFARFYAANVQTHDEAKTMECSGTVVSISPWNFPMAIFAGQCLGALAAGNAVIAKPAEQTPIMAFRVVELMHQAGVPRNSLQLLLGSGADVGQSLTGDRRVNGVCFTGSTLTAQRINRNMAYRLAPNAVLIAETGGLNAMIVDSTALPEQVVRDVVASAFQSAGQRCSALRVLYVQDVVADKLLSMLFGAMDELVLGDPRCLSTDIGPVIDSGALHRISQHIEKYRLSQKVLKQCQCDISSEGHYVAPTVIELDSISQLSEEIFGPVLHVVRYSAKDLDQVIQDINRTGFGLTFGLHSRLDQRVNDITRRINVGNIYVNRNQIGAVVGSQPFGGEGLSGTGPKAGGPLYVSRLRIDTLAVTEQLNREASYPFIGVDDIQRAIDSVALNEVSWPNQDLAGPMPGPTGELNVYSLHPRGIVLCLGPGAELVHQQASIALAAGNAVVCVSEDTSVELERLVAGNKRIVVLRGCVASESLQIINGFHAVVWQGAVSTARQYKQMLAERHGAILPLILDANNIRRYQIERHLCVDTTAAGGNASLLDVAQ